MIATKCFLISCVLFCQELVANPSGGYKYTDPYPVQIDYECMQQELGSEYLVE